MWMLAGSRRHAAEHPLADIRFGRTGLAAIDHVRGA
jgi:hypothetical protein